LVCTDDRYLPLDSCPRFDLSGIRWPGVSVPEAFKKRGDADLHHPDSVHWAQVQNDLRDAIRTARFREDRVVILEGLMVCADHAGARSLASMCDAFLLLAPGDSSPAAQEVLWKRKYLRSHLGNKSYKDRGVTEQEYHAYWAGYVWPRWLEHGFMDRRPKRSEVVNCLTEPEAVAEACYAATASLLKL